MARKSKKRKKKPIKLAQVGRFSYLSSHAIERLGERTQMNVDEMNHLLDHQGYFKLGSHAGFHRVHLLFYSPKDENFFVAIQDERMGKVVTILPTAYHDKLAWRILPEDREQAKQKFDAYYQACQSTQNTVAPKPTEPKPTKNPVKVQKLARFVYRFYHDNEDYERLEFINKETSSKKPKFTITISYIDKDLRAKRKKLMKVASGNYDGNVKKMWQDEQVLARIDETIQQKNIQQQSIFLLEVLNQKKSLLDYIHFREQEESYRYMQKYLLKLEMMYHFLQTLDFNVQGKVLLPKYPKYPALLQKDKKSVLSRKLPSRKQLAKLIFTLILLALLYKAFKEKIKKFFSLR